MLENLNTLCALSGVSGAEDEVRDYILQRALPLADAVDTDAMGNVIVHKKGAAETARKLLLCAHMDEVGLIVTGVTEEGFLRFASVGGIDRRVLPGKRVYIGRERLPGVIGCKPYHLVDKKEESTCPKEEELLIDTAKEQSLPYQIEVLPGNSGTDAWPIQVSRGGVATALVSLPLKYMHTPVETLLTSDAENIIELLTGFLSNAGELL